jgi:hypothetical protein
VPSTELIIPDIQYSELKFREFPDNATFVVDAILACDKHIALLSPVLPDEHRMKAMSFSK